MDCYTVYIASILSDRDLVYSSQRRLPAAADADAAGKGRGNDPGRKPQLKLAAAVGWKACSER